MAKQLSLKTQILQQIANSQVQQAMQQNQNEQLIADFNTWKQQQDNNAQLLADFDAWKSSQNPQPVEQAPQITQVPQIPSIADYKQNAVDRAVERRQRLNQMDIANAKKRDKEAETLATIAGLSNKISNIVPNVDALSTIAKKEEPKKEELKQIVAAQRPETADFSSPTAARLNDKSTFRGGEKWNQSVKDTLNMLNSDDVRTLSRLPQVVDTEPIEDKASRWLSPDVKLTETEKKLAKEYASQELQKFNYGPNHVPMLETPEDRQHYADMVNLINKTNGFTNFMQGAVEVPYNLAEMVSDGARSVGNQLKGLGSAITDKLGITEGATKRHNEEVAAANAIADQKEASMRQSFKNAQTQDPAAYTTGKIAGQTGMYMLTNPVFDGIAAGAGIESELAKFFINQGAQNVQDLVLDTAPSVKQLMEDGATPEEVKREALNNILWNAAGNAVMGGAGTLLSNRAARKAAQISGMEDVDNVVRNATNQAEEATKNLEDIAKQLPEVEEPSLTNPFEGIDKQVIEQAEKEVEPVAKPVAETVEDTVEAPKKYLSPEDEDQVMYDLEKIYEPYYRPEVREAIENTNFAIPNAVINEELDKNGKTIYKIVHADTQKEIKSLKSQKAAEKALADYLDGTDLKNRVQKAWTDIGSALDKYEKAVFHAEDVKEVEAAKKAVDAARKRYERAMKEFDPSFSSEITSQKYGQLVSNPYYVRNPQAKNPIDEKLAEELINDWNQDLKNPNRFVEDVSKRTENAAKDYSIQEINRKGGKKGYYVAESVGDTTKNVEPGKVYKSKEEAEKALGQYKLQTFAGGDTPKEKWKTSQFYENTAKKQGWTDQLDKRDYGYRVYSQAEQNADAAAKNLSADDLIYKDQFDPSDVKQAMKRQRELLNNGDEESLRKAQRLGRKIAFETREGGRIPQALAEFDRTTPEGQVRFAQNAIDDIVDKKVGTGTSEALDNIIEKINKAYDKHGNNKEAFAQEVEDILNKDIRNYAGGKNAPKMQSRKIKGKDKVLEMIKKGATLDEISDVIYKQNGGVKLTIQEEKQIYDLLKQAQKLSEGSYEQEELLSKAARIATAKAPSTVGQKIRSFLYNNMLGNFKTAVSRNAFGNLAYQTLEQARSPFAAAVDKATSLVTKKHSALGWNKEKFASYGKGFKKGALEQISDMRKGIDTGRSGAKGWEMALANNATTYDDTKLAGQLANKVEYYVRNAMELGDRPFYEANYAQQVTELRQLIDRYGKDNVAGLSGIKDADLDNVIDMIASVRAADEVFQKHGKMSKGLTDLRNGLGKMSEGVVGVDILSTAASPFTMTPGNMIERAIEYTPLGAFKNAAETAREVLGKKGFNQRRFVDEASRTLAGLPVLYGSYKLAQKGGINGSYSDDADEKAAQQEDGYIEYGLNVPDNVPLLGGKTLDTSDLPVYGPFMQAGAVIAENGLTPMAGLQAAEAVLGGSTTQGLRRAFGADSAGYSSSGTLSGMVDNFKNTVLSSGSQLIPSLARQTAQTIDPYKRDLGEYGTTEYYLNLMKNSDPVGRQSLPIKTDVEGNPVLQNQGRNIGSKILENYFLPMNMSEYDQSPLNKEASRLLESATTAMGFVPKAARKDLRSWDEKAEKEYSEGQFRTYKKDLGKLNSEAGNALINSDFYKGLSDTEKAKTLSDTYSAMKQVAKENATGLGTDDKLALAYKDGGTEGMLNYLAGKDATKDSGYQSTSKVGKAIQEAADKGDTEAAYTMSEQVQLLPDYGLDQKGPAAAYTKAYGVYDGLSASDFSKTYKAIDADHNQALKKAEVIDYMNKKSMGQSEGMKFWKAYAKTEGSSPWKIPSLKDGTWK